ncbi:hypothetical protein ACFL6I_07860 [candidate division KSB1 bacterium]
MVKKQFFSPLIMITVCSMFLLSSFQSAYAQKLRPPGTQSTHPDSLAKARADSLAAENERLLPSLMLQEYTITGVERTRILPSQRNPINMADFTRREHATLIYDRENREAPGAGGEKQGRAFVQPATSVVNEAYASFGKYSDANAGLKYRKKLTNSELYTDLDIRRGSGHVDYADYYTFSGNIADVRTLINDVQNRAQLAFNAQEYQFYGSQNSPGLKRSGYYVELSNISDILRWEPLQTSFEFGGRYYDPDKSELFNWDLWSKLNLRSLFGTTFLYGSFEMNTDRIKDGSHGNAPVSDSNYGKAFVAFESLITPRLHLKAGAAYYNAESKNANWLYSYESNGLNVTGPFLQERKYNEFYPQATLTFNFGEQGQFFFEYEPRIDSFTLVEKLSRNQYLMLTSPLSYENVSQSVKIGWRRSYVYDLSFELYYNDRKVENYGILVDNSLGLNASQQGIWSLVYDNTVDANEYRGAVTWNPHPRFSAWSSMSYTDYTVRESTFADRVTYVPNFIGELSLQFSPGWGTQFVLDGQFIDSRDTTPYEQVGVKDDLNSYFLSNITITKQWARRFSTYFYVYNIFNEDYEAWQGYVAPDLMGGGGLRFFW